MKTLMLTIAMMATLTVCAATVNAGTNNLPAKELKQEPSDLRSYFVKAPLPNYPQTAFTWHKQGSGWFRLNIDPETGVVTSIKVLKSTGVKILDDSAAAAYMQWRAKPHLIDHAILPANFVVYEEFSNFGIKDWPRLNP
jgi:TonB family protein